MGDRITMSQRERDRLKTLHLVQQNKCSQVEAARLLNLSTRQIRRILRRLAAEGDVGLIHRSRGRPSHARKDALLRKQVLRIYAKDYRDYNLTFACERLSARGLDVSRETLRQWLLSAGLWRRRRKHPKHRTRRDRKACFGEMVQTDGSIHDWLEGRGPQLTLLVMIDDAMSESMAWFAPAETTEGYFELLGQWLRTHGRMKSLYADGRTVFFGKDGQSETTQFGRACKELGIELIRAYSPQAKGRVERFNGTAQDRLVKMLREAKAKTIEQANAVLTETFLPWFNKHCTVEPASGINAHRPNHPSMPLARILCPHHERTVMNDYTIRLKGRVYQLRKPVQPGLRGGKVTVEERIDGPLKIRFHGKLLKFDEIQPAAKATVGQPEPPVATQTPRRQAYRPPANHPWRQAIAPDKTVRSAYG